MTAKIIKYFRAIDRDTNVEVVKTNNYFALCALIDRGVVNPDGVTFEIETADGVLNITGRKIDAVSLTTPLRSGETYKTMIEDHGDMFKLIFVETEGAITEETYYQSNDGDFGFGIF